MKRFYLFFLLVIGTWTNVNANQQKQSYLKVGDWFECEMEFIDNVPVFRNHWANNDSISPTQCYIVTRFNLKERLNDSTEIWSYKIIRHRSLSPGFSTKHENDETKLYCFDTWYPNYLSENIDSIRQNLTGEIRLINGELDNHKYNYGEFSFSLTTLFTENEQGSFYSSSLSGLDISIHLQVENIVSLIFSAKNLNKGAEKLGNRYSVDNLNFTPANSASFNIKPHNLQSTPNTYTAYFESHGLAYAFTDKYQQKVLAITQASFDIPNKAIITLIDAREKPEKINENLYLVDLWPQNQSHVISKKENELNGKTQYTYELKCGVEFIVNAGTASIRPMDLFVCPEDSIQIIIQDSTVLFQGKSYTIDTMLFEGTNNYKYPHAKPALTSETIQRSDFSNEYKAYLMLSAKIHEEYENILKENPTLDKYKKALVDFTYLKSYHYNGLFEHRNDATFISMSNHYRENIAYEWGAPLSSDFRIKYYRVLSNLNHFALYGQLFKILNNSIDLDHENYYNEYLKMCADTLLTQKLSAHIEGVRSIEVGKLLPITELLRENGDKINILPAKGKYGLLFLHDYPLDYSQFRKALGNYNNNKIQLISYCITGKSDSLLKQVPSSLSEADSLIIKGNYKMYPSIYNYLNTTLSNKILLYNDKGTIIYSSSYYKPYDSPEKSYADILNNAIRAFESRPKTTNSTKQILFVLFISILGTGLLAVLIYRFQTKRIKKRNEREQLIQQLKLKSVQSQLNPHFLFNALNSIQVLIKSNDIKQADKYLVGFSGLLRTVLQNADKQLVTLTDELEMVERYCDLEKLRINFDCELDVDTTMDIGLIEVPYMLLQPLIENAVKHGIAKTAAKGMLQIQIKEANSELRIYITDNGPGINGTSIEKLSIKGKGLKLCTEKLESIYGNEAEFVISDANPGTRVSIKIKIG
ncbi:MAG: histidine kinase [Prolixibacteraceae bacterium]|nr:histidine kinase [Prolixibacteraceae bacterium]MBN2648967.1 histidine kinase [Prolixibacteraceae bacterium]